MSPMLRGEAVPLPRKELDELRADLARHYGDQVVETGGEPVLVVRVPHRVPDFLRDVEGAAETIPYRDLRGFRAVVLIGDDRDMGVSAEMLRALLEERERTERDWVAGHRVKLRPGTFTVERLPADPQRRLGAVFRVDADSVQDLDESAFDDVAEALPEVKRASPGGVRPAFAFVVAHADHVRLPGARFFTELETKQKVRQREALEAKKRALEEKHEAALAAMRRIEKRRAEATAARAADRAPSVPTRSPSTASPPLRPSRGTGGRSADDILAEVRAELGKDTPVRPASTTAMPPPPADVAPPLSASPQPAAPEPATTAPSTPDPAFDPAYRHPAAMGAIRHALDAAGYKIKDELMVQGVPITFAAARPEGYPSRVLVTFWGRLEPDDARRLIKLGRSIDVELLLAVAEDIPQETERVALATNLKAVPVEAAGHVRFS